MLTLATARRMGVAGAGVALACTLSLAGCDSARRGYEPVVGDLLFQSSPQNPLVAAIEGCTRSPFSHVGIVARQGDRWTVVEATGPGVVETDLDDFLRRGREGGFAVYRLDQKYADRIPATITAARKYLGKPYDIRYEFDDEKIYCSELIYKAFKSTTGEELGTVRKLGDLAWQNFEAFIRKLENGDLPLERPMITPRDMSEATQLKPVFRHGI